jgi:hypothetical protein
MCVYCHMPNKSRVGRSGLIFFFIIIGKTENSRTYRLWTIGQAKQKICVFTVTRPTLIFASDPMNFYTEFG